MLQPTLNIRQLGIHPPDTATSTARSTGCVPCTNEQAGRLAWEPLAGYLTASALYYVRTGKGKGKGCQMVGEQHVYLCLFCCTFFVPQSLCVGVFT